MTTHCFVACVVENEHEINSNNVNGIHSAQTLTSAKVARLPFLTAEAGENLVRIPRERHREAKRNAMTVN